MKASATQPKRAGRAQPLQVPKWDIGGADTIEMRRNDVGRRMVVELLLYFADRGGYERSCARVTDGGDDPG